MNLHSSKLYSNSVVEEQENHIDEEVASVCHHLHYAMKLRGKYVFQSALAKLPKKITGPVTFDPSAVTFPPASQQIFKFVKGTYMVYDDAAGTYITKFEFSRI